MISYRAILWTKARFKPQTQSPLSPAASFRLTVATQPSKTNQSMSQVIIKPCTLIRTTTTCSKRILLMNKSIIPTHTPSFIYLYIYWWTANYFSHHLYTNMHAHTHNTNTVLFEPFTTKQEQKKRSLCLSKRVSYVTCYIKRLFPTSSESSFWETTLRWRSLCSDTDNISGN